MSFNVTGIDSDLYLVDNPIYIGIDITTPNISYIELRITNMSNQQPIKPMEYFPLFTGNNIGVFASVTIDLSKIVKAIMKEPLNFTNYSFVSSDIVYPYNYEKLKLELVHKESGGFVYSIQTITKTFIRGGIPKNKISNNHLSVNDLLLVSDKIPRWNGYPCDYYFIKEDKRIWKSNVIPEELIEKRIPRGCEGIYLKFRNHLGGFQYWLFENYTDEVRNRSLGSIDRYTNDTDLGNEIERGLEVTSKVPNKYVSLINDLISSQEIYMLVRDDDGTNWLRISSENNRIKQNVFDVNTKVNLKFNPYYDYNPSLLW